MAPPPQKPSSKFSPERLATAQRYLTAFVERYQSSTKANDRGYTAAAAALDVSQPTITNALGPMGSFGPKLLEALARVDRVSFDKILDWDPVRVAGSVGAKELPASTEAALEGEREKKAKRSRVDKAELQQSEDRSLLHRYPTDADPAPRGEQLERVSVSR